MRAVVGAAIIALAAGQLCDPAINCQFQINQGATVHRWDFSSLCGQGNGPLGDYLFNDGLGHDYSANICGAASKKCLPKGWVQTYEYGVAVQSWGSVPPCNASDPTTMTCKEKNGLIPSCCTEDCQVLGVGSPKLTLTNPLDITGGMNATFNGAPPDDDDPFWCPWNPQTGSQFPRTVTFEMQCDKLVAGAIPILAVQNKTEDCDYLLIFASNLACPDTTSRPRPAPRRPSQGLSGGAIFAIVFFVALFVYIVVGMLITYRKEGGWYCPNRFFWSGVGTRIGALWTWLLFCGKTSESSGSTQSAFLGTGATNPYTAGATATGSYSTGGYNAGATTATPTAYTDL